MKCFFFKVKYKSTPELQNQSNMKKKNPASETKSKAWNYSSIMDLEKNPASERIQHELRDAFY